MVKRPTLDPPKAVWGLGIGEVGRERLLTGLLQVQTIFRYELQDRKFTAAMS